MTASTAPAGPTGRAERPRYWVAPWRMDGRHVREAARPGLSAPARALAFLVLVAVCALGGGVAGATGHLEIAVLVFVAAFGGYVLLLRRATTNRRRSWGMVQVTGTQFDLLVALSQVPVERVDEGRRAHDHLVWLLQQPRPHLAAVTGWESWSRHLLAG